MLGARRAAIGAAGLADRTAGRHAGETPIDGRDRSCELAVSGGSAGVSSDQEPKLPLVYLPLGMFVLGGLIGAVILSALFASAAQSLVGTFDDLRVLLAGQVGLWLGLVPAVVLAARHHQTEVRSFAGLRMERLDPLWALLGPVLQVVIGVAYSPFVNADELGKTAQRLVDLAEGQVGPYLLLCVSTVIGAPLVEELFFRGLVLRAGRRIGIMAGILLSAVLFAAVHVQLLQFPALACFGALCAYLAVRYDRLGPSIWLHVGFNAATMATMAWRVFR